MKDNFDPFELFEKVVELVPPESQASYLQLIVRLRKFDPNDEILLIVWGVFLACRIIAHQFNGMTNVLRGINAANSYYAQLITQSGLNTYGATKERTAQAENPRTPAAIAPTDRSALSKVPTRLETRERNDLTRWMKILFIMNLITAGSLLAMVTMYAHVHAVEPLQTATASVSQEKSPQSAP